MCFLICLKSNEKKTNKGFGVYFRGVDLKENEQRIGTGKIRLALSTVEVFCFMERTCVFELSQRRRFKGNDLRWSSQACVCSLSVLTICFKPAVQVCSQIIVLLCDITCSFSIVQISIVRYKATALHYDFILLLGHLNFSCIPSIQCLFFSNWKTFNLQL